MISRTSNELPCFVILDDGFYWKVRIEMADGVRFELTQDCSWPVFKTGVFNRSTTHPQKVGYLLIKFTSLCVIFIIAGIRAWACSCFNVDK